MKKTPPTEVYYLSKTEWSSLNLLIKKIRTQLTDSEGQSRELDAIAESATRAAEAALAAAAQTRAEVTKRRQTEAQLKGLEAELSGTQEVVRARTTPGQAIDKGKAAEGQPVNPTPDVRFVPG